MTRNEIRLALKEMEDAYTLRIFLDNRTTVLAHAWSLVEAKRDQAEADSADSDSEGLLRVTVGRRQALIAISRIVVIQRVPFGW